MYRKGVFSERDPMAGGGVAGCRVEDFVKVMCTLLYLKWITSKNLLYSTWNSQCYVPAWMGGGLEEDEHMYMYG